MLPVYSLLHMPTNGPLIEVSIPPDLRKVAESGMYFIEHEFLKPEDTELMQWTGYQTSAGQDIYEGDIIEFRNEHGIFEKKFKVYFTRGAYWLAYGSPPDLGLHNALKYGLSMMPSTCFTTVAGNIYENFEFLEQK